MKHFMISPALMAVMAATPHGVIGSARGDAGAVALQLAQMKTALDKATTDVQQTAEKALKQAEQTGGLTAELKQTADTMLANFNALSQSHAAMTAKMEALEGKNRDLEQEVSARGGKGENAPMSLGATIAADERIKQYVDRGVSGSQIITVQNAITSAAGSAGGMIFTDVEAEPVRMPRRTLSVLALLSRGRTGSNMVTYTKQTTRANAAAHVAEGASAPASNYGWSKAEANVRKAKHITHISEEALADAAQLQTEIDTEMRYGLDLALEQQLVAGDGTGENFSGLRLNATAFAAAAGLPNETRIDRLRLALLQLSLANYSADGLLLNDTDWAAIELLKDTTGRYIFGNPGVAAGTPRLWNLDVATTTAQSAGEWMAGNFLLAATYYDRNEVEVLFSTEHGTNFVDGMVTATASRRGALAVKREAALVKGDFTFA